QEPSRGNVAHAGVFLGASIVVNQECNRLGDDTEPRSPARPPFRSRSRDRLRKRRHRHPESKMVVRCLAPSTRASTRLGAELSAVLECLGEAVAIVDASGTPLVSNAAYDALYLKAGGKLTFVDDIGAPVAPELAPV